MFVDENDEACPQFREGEVVVELVRAARVDCHLSDRLCSYS